MTRLLSIQMAPQIRLLQNADQEVVDKLRIDLFQRFHIYNAALGRQCCIDRPLFQRFRIFSKQFIRHFIDQ